MPTGPQAGEPVRGTVYEFDLTITEIQPNRTESKTTSRAHVAVLDGIAYLFFPCA
jgi:hypothetical protein